MKTERNCKKEALLFLLTIVLLTTVVHANMEERPNSITVAVTGFSNTEKANCPLLVEKYGGGDPKVLDKYIHNSIENGTSGFLNLTINFENYVKDVLPNEWMAGFWASPFWWAESLRAGAMAAKLAPWYTIRSFEELNTKKWPITDAHVVDFTCDQMYNETTQLRTNQSVDDTWDYYAQSNVTGTEKVLEALYTRGSNGVWKKETLGSLSGFQMMQWGTDYFNKKELPWEYMFNYYYNNSFLAQNINLKDGATGRIAQNQTWKFYLTVPNNTYGFDTRLTSIYFPTDLSFILKDPSNNIIYSDIGLLFSKNKTIMSPTAGIWGIEVRGNIIPLQGYSMFTLSTDIIDLPPSQAGTGSSGTGGINFTSLNLNYISTCDSVINITNATVQASDFFLTALTIPDHKMWVTMVFESPCGDVLLVTFVRENPIMKSIFLSDKEAL